MADAQGEDQFGRVLEATVAGGTIDVNPEPNRSALFVDTVTVVSAGTPVQGPNVTVPDGFSAAFRMRSTQSGQPNGYVASSMANAGSSANRLELLKGEGDSLFVDNFNRLWFDADTNGVVFELFVEQ